MLTIFSLMGWAGLDVEVVGEGVVGAEDVLSIGVKLEREESGGLGGGELASSSLIFPGSRALLVGVAVVVEVDGDAG